MICKKYSAQRPEGLTFDYLAMSEKLNTPVRPSSVGLSPSNGDVLPVARATENGQTLPNGSKYEIWHMMPDGKYHNLTAIVIDSVTRHYTDGKLNAEAIETYNKKGYLVSSQIYNSQE